MPSRTKPQSARYSRPSDSQAAADAIPILVDDVYHVFHLSTPPNTIRHPPRLRSSWSHLRSTDLVTWERSEQEALHPGKATNSPDADGAWTGAAIIGPDGNMHIFYTGYSLSQGGKQVILHARSNDKHGSQFSKATTPITISGVMDKFEDIDFRDAYVSWNEAEQCYWMLVATRLRTGPYWTRGCLALLTSPDLETWTIDPEPFYAPNDMFCPECPEVFSLPNGKWYLVYSRFHSPDSGTVYRIADSPRGPWRTPRATSGGRLDARRWYAAKSCPKAGDPSKRVYFGWIADKLDGQWSWGGDMGIPREVYADDQGYLITHPSQEYLGAEFGSQSEDVQIPKKLELEATGRTSTHFLPELPAKSDYLYEFSITNKDAASFGLMFRTDSELAGHRLRFTPLPGASPLYDMALLSCPPPLDDFWADQYNLHLPREVDGPEIARHPAVNLTNPIVVIVRSDVLEIFAGGKSISHRLTSSVGSATKQTESNGHSNGESNGLSEAATSGSGLRELGWFVEDGKTVVLNETLQRRTA